MSSRRQKTTLIGHCQVCEREIKSSLGRIAHHGYERPGSGYQTASCMGALELAYERGHDALDRYIVMINGELTDLKTTRAKHNAERFPVPNPDHKWWMLSRWRRGEEPPREIAIDDARYEERRRHYLSNLDTEIRHTDEYLSRLRKRRADWTLRDLESVSEEIEQRTAAEKAARKADVDAKRAARTAKANARRERLTTKYAIACELAIDNDGRGVYCFSHGVKNDARGYRDLPRKITGESCYRKRSFEKYGTE